MTYYFVLTDQKVTCFIVLLEIPRELSLLMQVFEYVDLSGISKVREIAFEEEDKL